MEEIKRTLSLTDYPAITKRVFTEDTLLFDIETTGFSPKTSDLYLIGVACRSGEDALIEQFLSDDASEQALLLERFEEILKSHTTIFTYNGVGFDLPYLREKYGYDPFSDHTIRDLYKDLTRLRSFLGLPNLKQKTVEDFLGLSREDTYSGGDLIPVYRHYAATHDDLPKKLLLLHNYEDVLGMIDSVPMLSYPEFFDGKYHIEGAAFSDENTALCIKLIPAYPFPVRIETTRDPFSLIADGNLATLFVQLYEGELKYFFPDPENYYYLPEEDTALHKSVGGFVDKKHRKQATKSTAYTKKEGVFLPQPKEICTPSFTTSYHDSLSYFLFSEDFTQDSEVFRNYVDACLRYLIK